MTAGAARPRVVRFTVVASSFPSHVMDERTTRYIGELEHEREPSSRHVLSNEQACRSSRPSSGSSRVVHALVLNGGVRELFEGYKDRL
jgi:hypothetical protein